MGRPIQYAHSACSLDFPLRSLHIITYDDRGPRRPQTFKFENFWTFIPGFTDVDQKAWAEPTPRVDPYHVLHHKSRKTGTRQIEWSMRLFSKSKVHLHAALLIILHRARRAASLHWGARSSTQGPEGVISLLVIERA